MPAFAPITIFDGASTPVAHVFVPNGESPKDSAITRWKKSTGVKQGDYLLSTSLRDSGTKTKFRAQLTLPVMVTETINGVSVPRVVRSIFADLTLTMDETSTQGDDP